MQSPLVRSASASLMESMETLANFGPTPFHHDYSDWWFGTFFILPYIGNFIIPTDFHIFQRGRYTTNKYCIVTFHAFFRIASLPGNTRKPSVWLWVSSFLGTWDDSPCHPHVQPPRRGCDTHRSESERQDLHHRWTLGVRTAQLPSP